MALNLAALARKRDAVLAKNLDDIMARKPYLPYVGTDYTRAQIVTWFQNITDQIADAIVHDYTLAQVNTFFTDLYNGMAPGDQVIALQIKNDQPYDLGQASSLAGLQNLIKCVIFKFAITT